MKDIKDTFAPDLSGLERDDWLKALESLAEDYGYFEPLGTEHSAAFFEGGPTLLVTFESYDEIRARSPGRLPRGFEFVNRRGWSLLTIVAHEQGWFRDLRLYKYFDRLVDDGFFEDFDKVAFFGIHQGGYAAAAYSVAAPGSRVLAVRPVATLDPAVTGFDRRHKAARRLCFTDRYGYAPDMIDAANRAYILFDPLDSLDSAQAALFTRPNVLKLPCRGMGGRIDSGLDQFNGLSKLICSTVSGELDTENFGQIYRERRNSPLYLRTLLAQCERAGRLEMALMICDLALEPGPNPYFTKRRDVIEKRRASEQA